MAGLTHTKAAIKGSARVSETSPGSAGVGATSKITHTAMDRIQFLVGCCLEDSFISCLVDSKQGSLQYGGDWLPSQPARKSKMETTAL